MNSQVAAIVTTYGDFHGRGHLPAYSKNAAITMSVRPTIPSQPRIKRGTSELLLYLFLTQPRRILWTLESPHGKVPESAISSARQAAGRKHAEPYYAICAVRTIFQRLAEAIVECTKTVRLRNLADQYAAIASAREVERRGRDDWRSRLKSPRAERRRDCQRPQAEPNPKLTDVERPYFGRRVTWSGCARARPAYVAADISRLSGPVFILVPVPARS